MMMMESLILKQIRDISKPTLAQIIVVKSTVMSGMMRRTSVEDSYNPIVGLRTRGITDLITITTKTTANTGQNIGESHEEGGEIISQGKLT